MNILWEYVQQCETSYDLWSCGELLTVCWESKSKNHLMLHVKPLFCLFLISSSDSWRQWIWIWIGWACLFQWILHVMKRNPCSGFIRSQCFCSEIGLFLTALKLKVISSTLTTGSSGWDWRKGLHRFKYPNYYIFKEPKGNCSWTWQPEISMKRCNTTVVSLLNP